MEVDSVRALVGFQLRGLALYGSFYLWQSLSNNTRNILLLVLAFISFRYAWVVFRYRQARRRYHNSDSHTFKELPPTYPSLIPFLGNATSLMLDTASFIRLATLYKGTSTSTRISILGSVIYLFQDKETITKILKQRDNLTPISIRFVFPAKALFGMPERNGLDAYRLDNSGPLEKPRAGSNVPSPDRIDHLHHQAFRSAFTGPGLAPITSRFQIALSEKFNNIMLDSSEWMEIDDLFTFIAKIVSASLTDAIFGQSLLNLHPDFIDNLWEFDRALPWLVRLTPRWMDPHPHKTRDRVIEQIRQWHASMRRGSRENRVGPEGRSDPHRGSGVIGHLRQVLMGSGKHSDDAMAAHDLGLIWGATSNAASAASLATFHIFKDRDLLGRVRSETGKCQSGPFEIKRLGQIPLLSSIYAEILRLYSGVFLMVASPPDADVLLGKWKFPRGSCGLVSPALAHVDENFWNTKDDLYPVDTFWADRFVIYPGDPTSGPVRPDHRKQKVGEEGDFEPYCSTENLDGSWIPYGAGVGMCPGRFLAKNVIISTYAWLVEVCDIEIMTESFDMNPWRFGLSVEQPQSPIIARIRKRK